MNPVYFTVPHQSHYSPIDVLFLYRFTINFLCVFLYSFMRAIYTANFASLNKPSHSSCLSHVIINWCTFRLSIYPCRSGSGSRSRSRSPFYRIHDSHYQTRTVYRSYTLATSVCNLKTEDRSLLSILSNGLNLECFLSYKTLCLS